jgi:hypothetical protein
MLPKFENVLMREYEIERGQLDALWSYFGHKGQDDEQEAEEGKKALLTTNEESTERGVYWRSTGDPHRHAPPGRSWHREDRNGGIKGTFSDTSAKSRAPG